MEQALTQVNRLGYSHARIKHENRSRGERSEQVTRGHVMREGVRHCICSARGKGRAAFV